MAGRENSAQQYLKKHRIMELFDNLTSHIIYERPEDPKVYTCHYLEKLRDARTAQRNYPCLFDDSNIRSLFGMLDVTGKGYITYEQYNEGLETLGIEKFNRNPVGADMDKISTECFLKEARQGLAQASSTFSL